MTIILIFLPEVMRTLTISEYLVSARPNTSKPAPRFAVEQKALPTAWVREALIARPRPMTNREANKRGLVLLREGIADSRPRHSHSAIMNASNFVTLNTRILWFVSLAVVTLLSTDNLARPPEGAPATLKCETCWAI